MIEPGTLIIWKEYSKFKRWFYKLIGKELPFNRITVMQIEGTFDTFTEPGELNFMIYSSVNNAYFE